MGGSFGQASGDETAALARQLRVGPEAQAFSEGLVVHPSGLLTDLGTEPILRAFPAALEPERFITGLRLIQSLSEYGGFVSRSREARSQHFVRCSFAISTAK